ncbi:hypothetical protein SAMN04487901_106151 [Prevotella communis]|uniref:Uncharacterized protein n=2 Tax=Prevotella communis TaxID=2913614 RepID=A0A1G7VV60_9BACT|nr:hypothetical protein SAMN04487901_106151 [Prevotella communis]
MKECLLRGRNPANLIKIEQNVEIEKNRKNSFFLEPNINDSFLMNINSWTSQATKGRAAINWNIRSALPLLPRP